MTKAIILLHDPNKPQRSARPLPRRSVSARPSRSRLTLRAKWKYLRKEAKRRQRKSHLLSGRLESERWKDRSLSPPAQVMDTAFAPENSAAILHSTNEGGNGEMRLAGLDLVAIWRVIPFQTARHSALTGFVHFIYKYSHAHKLLGLRKDRSRTWRVPSSQFSEGF